MNWNKSPLSWREGSTEYISVVFTWDLPKVRAMVQQRKIGVDKYIVGGPAVKMLPNYFDGDRVEIQNHYPGVLQKYNPLATRTSNGCPNKCGFCAVRKIHPEFEELREFPILPVVCDDNLLACSRKHFNQIIDRLKTLDWCDFNQGLDASFLTQYHADRFAELKNPKIRLAWDGYLDGIHVEEALKNLRKAGIPRKNISCYVLIGYKEAPPVEALYKLETIYYCFGIMPYPMRYQPIKTLRKNEYVDPDWTNKELDRFMSYWANLRFTASVPFDEYEHHKKTKSPNQLELAV